jgi:hypothetical protein
MKKLEDIPKQNIFEVPDGYFDRLPLKIQERVARPVASPWLLWAPALRYAVPVLLLAGMGIFWYQQNTPMTIEDELARIQDDQLSLFLADESLSTDDLLETMTWSEEDLQSLENQVYATFDASETEWNELLDELELQ